MPIRLLPSGRWQLRVRNPDTLKYVSLGTYSTEVEAIKAEGAYEAGHDLTQPEVTKVIPKGREKFGKFALEVIQSRKHILSPSTYHFHLWNLEAHLKDFENIAVADITYSKVIKWWHSKESTLNSRKQSYGTLSMVMRRAVKLGLIPSSPCMVEGASKDFSKKRPTFHAGDVRMLLTMCDDQQMEASLLVLMGTGCRIGELLALTWSDVDLDAGTISISKHLTIHGVQDGTKSHADGKRTLIMPQEATGALLMLSKTRELALDAPVFLNARGGQLSYHKFRDRFKALRDSVGLDDLHIHDLRHIHLSEYTKHGATMREVMDRAGHSDYSSALRYQHSSTDREKELVSKLSL